ncbi:MAG: branched-chain amino acid ABC transporter substrate-binding protein [Alkalispirochaetaceae bacterium]
MRTSRLLVVTVVLLLSAAVAFGGGQGEAETIKIGVAGAHSGDLASYGIPTIHAAELVVEEINANGGINGQLIELVVEDDQCRPEVATNTAALLAGEEVVAVIGHICSGATRAALGTYTSENIVTISPSSTNPGLTQDGEFPVFFRTIAPDDAQGQLQAEFVADELGLESVAILHDGGDYGQGLADFARTALEENYPDVEIALYEGVTPGAVDYSAIINRVAQSGAEAVIFGGYHPEASKLVGQMRTQGLDTVFVSGDGVNDETFINVAGSDAEGVYASGPTDTSSNEMFQMAAEAHREEYGEDPGPFFMNAYAAAIAITNAIEEAGSTDPEAIMEALRGNPVATPLGEISFNDQGDAEGVGFAMYQVQDGEFTQVQ